ncbi:hypothetical protein [Marinobacterium jannaschii]|uniref:hypothetical protein n=1 Tax=Marinobacterium jannaschii TaxID=64970 RepID=UPI00068538B2|nr:hypothetical protein [Marinobacterium jannaschii]
MNITDDFINSLFEGTNFGEAINNSVTKKRNLIAKTLRNQLDGFWSGHTAYSIVVTGGLLLDTKSGQPKHLTAIGEAFMKEYESKDSGKSVNEWTAINIPEDIDIKGKEVLIWDGCDHHIDYVDICPESGTFYMANGTEPTHWKPLDRPQDPRPIKHDV